jgi:flavin reductase (DIM6/NTAB) family NADH-FMN oxidoreductase RutF
MDGAKSRAAPTLAGSIFRKLVRSVSISESEFRKALGLFPTGVAIVTAIAKAGERFGITVSSFNSVSLSPPLVLFSVARSANSFPLMANALSYAISVLGEHQSALSTRFARQGDKWAGLTPVDGLTGLPLIPGALVSFECEPYASYEGGDHMIFVGRVVSIHRADTAGRRPLVFCHGAYHGLDAGRGLHLHDEDSLWLQGW